MQDQKEITMKLIIDINPIGTGVSAAVDRDDERETDVYNYMSAFMFPLAMALLEGDTNAADAVLRWLPVYMANSAPPACGRTLSDETIKNASDSMEKASLDQSIIRGWHDDMIGNFEKQLSGGIFRAIDDLVNALGMSSGQTKSDKPEEPKEDDVELPDNIESFLNNLGNKLDS